MVFDHFGRHFGALRVTFRDSVLNWGSQGPPEQKRPKKDPNSRTDRAPRRDTFGPSSAHNFEKAIFYVIFGDFFGDSKKALKTELPKGGRMCNPTMPVHVSQGSAVVTLAPFWAPFWSHFGGQVRYYTPFWWPGWPKQAHKREAKIKLKKRL